MTLRDDIRPMLKSADTVAWEVSEGLVPYPQALARMDAEVKAIAHEGASERIWLLEHPPLYTAGTSANAADLVSPDRFPVFETGRGGQYTYHGPGQRVAYAMLDLKRRGGDVRAFVAGLEQWIIDTLDCFNVKGERREDRVGVWVRRGNREDKIAAIGIRVRHWVTFHGISINVDPDLSHFDGIVPCGIRQHGVTSLVDLGLPVTMADLDVALKAAFGKTFGDIA
jgi:lipoyl(octanoyl) transferase